MSGAGTQYREGTATEAEILDHLRSCDGDFVPRLSERVDMEAYARKIRAKARTFEAWSCGALVGLVAAYFNGEARSCFISNVSVHSQFAGHGIGAELVARCMRSSSEEGLACVSLEVHGENRAAIRLYEKAGFSTTGKEGQMLTMQAKIGGKGQA